MTDAGKAGGVWLGTAESPFGTEGHVAGEAREAAIAALADEYPDLDPGAFGDGSTAEADVREGQQLQRWHFFISHLEVRPDPAREQESAGTEESA
jgi:TPP-dependent pyruvate/acetoin dehydrogenase alpha subunit